jgi:hypothetical protein
MYTNLYLVEKLDRQHRQDFVDQAARDHTAIQVSNKKQTRSYTMRGKVSEADTRGNLRSGKQPSWALLIVLRTAVCFKRLPPPVQQALVHVQREQAIEIDMVVNGVTVQEKNLVH